MVMCRNSKTKRFNNNNNKYTHTHKHTHTHIYIHGKVYAKLLLTYEILTYHQSLQYCQLRTFFDLQNFCTECLVV